MILIGRGFELNTLKIFFKPWIGLGSNLTEVSSSGVEDFLKTTLNTQSLINIKNILNLSLKIPFPVIAQEKIYLVLITTREHVERRIWLTKKI